jgi:hypothetical protein
MWLANAVKNRHTDIGLHPFLSPPKNSRTRNTLIQKNRQWPGADVARGLMTNSCIFLTGPRIVLLQNGFGFVATYADVSGKYRSKDDGARLITRSRAAPILPGWGLGGARAEVHYFMSQGGEIVAE